MVRLRRLATVSCVVLCACNEPTAVLVAAGRDLPEGTALERSQLVEVSVSWMLATPNAVRPAALPSLVGRRLRVPLLKGDLLLASALVPAVAVAPAVVDRLDKNHRGVTLSVAGAEHVHAGSHVDLLAVMQDLQTGESSSSTLVQSISVLEAGELLPVTQGLALRRVTLQMALEDGEAALLASQAGALHLSLRNPENVDVLVGRDPATTATLLDTERRAALDAKQREVLPVGTLPNPGDSGDVGARLHRRLRAFTAVVTGAEHVRQGDPIDLVLTMKDPKAHEWVTLTPVQKATVLAVGATALQSPLRQVTVEVLPEQAELLALAQHIGQLQVLLRNPDDIDVMTQMGLTTSSIFGGGPGAADAGDEADSRHA
jgi:Flp pilus assembly protein CpaB